MRVKSQLIRRLSLLLLSNLLFGFVFCQSFNLVGTANSLGGNCYELTGGGVNQKGAIWSTTQIDLSQPFDMTFHVNFPIWGADGLAFVLHNDPAGLNAIARDPGNTLGAYRRLPGCTGSIPPCAPSPATRLGVEPGIAFEVDVWDNSGAGADDITPPACCKDDHISIINTMQPDVAILGPAQARNDTINITDDVCRRLRVTWDPGTQFMYMNFGGEVLSGNYDIINNIFGGTTNVYWGFAGSSGGVAATFQVCMENLTELPTDTFMCPGTPLVLTPNAFGSATYHEWLPVPATCLGWSHFSPGCGGCFGCCPGIAACCPTCTGSSYNWDPGAVGSYAISIDVTNGIGANGGCRDTVTINIEANCLLPIELASFEASRIDNFSQLDWVSTNEINASHFEIQRSLDDESFTPIGTVECQGGNQKIQEYSFQDYFPAIGLNYYRLKLVDLDGKTSLSEVRAVLYETPVENNLESVYPNPTTGVINFKLALKEATDIKIKIYNSTGSLVVNNSQYSNKAGIFISELKLNSVHSGIYFYNVIAGDKSFNGKIVLTK